MGERSTPTIVVVDGNNVVGAAADGWWRDRPAAVRRLVGRLRGYREATGDTVVLALDVPQPDLAEGENDGIAVRYPRRRGRDAADDRIVELVADLAAGPGEPPDTLVVVTSDRALAARVAPHGAAVTGAGAFLSRLRDLGV